MLLFAGLMVLLAVFSVIGYVVDHRIVVGAPVWAKPLKFALSFGVYAATLSWLLPRLHRPKVSRVANGLGNALAIGLLLEVGAIVLQAARGHASHFNKSTAFDTIVFIAMGIFAAAIFFATLGVAVAILLDRAVVDKTLNLALRLGLLISLAGMSIGFVMILPTRAQRAQSHPLTSGAHSVGVLDGGPSIPLLGWDTTGGDLRIAHFVGLHALQAIPLAAVVLGPIKVLQPSVRHRLIWIFAVAYGALFGLTLWQALRGQPITAPDFLTVAVAAGVAIATIAASILVLRLPTRQSEPGRAAQSPVPFTGKTASESDFRNAF